MSIFLWMLMGLAVYSFVLVPVLMELALDRPKRTKNGEIRIKRGFVMGNFYKKNCSDENKDYPKDLCQFYKGMYTGLLCVSFVFACVAFFWAIIYIVVSPIAIIVGYMPQRSIGFWTTGPLFCEYEVIGNKKWIAPWKFIVPIGLGYLSYELGYLIYRFSGERYQGLMGVLPTLSSNTAIIVYGSITGLVFLIILINKIRKTESFVASREVVGSFFKKFCKKIEIT